MLELNILPRNFAVPGISSKWLTEKIPDNPNANVELNPKLLDKIFNDNWPRLNVMTDRLGMPIEDNKRISYAIMDVMNVPLIVSDSQY